jgi:hypothetical protein
VKVPSVEPLCLPLSVRVHDRVKETYGERWRGGIPPKKSGEGVIPFKGVQACNKC